MCLSSDSVTTNLPIFLLHFQPMCPSSSNCHNPYVHLLIGLLSCGFQNGLAHLLTSVWCQNQMMPPLLMGYLSQLAFFSNSYHILPTSSLIGQIKSRIVEEVPGGPLSQGPGWRVWWHRSPRGSWAAWRSATSWVSRWSGPGTPWWRRGRHSSLSAWGFKAK